MSQPCLLGSVLSQYRLALLRKDSNKESKPQTDPHRHTRRQKDPKKDRDKDGQKKTGGGGGMPLYTMELAEEGLVDGGAGCPDVDRVDREGWHACVGQRLCQGCGG